MEALRAKLPGNVLLQGIVDPNGAATDVRVVQPLEASLEEAAREAFAQWEFQPAIRRGEPVPVATSIKMEFTMR